MPPICIAALVAQDALGLFHAHHDVGRLDDGDSLLALGQAERLDCLVGDGADDLVAVSELERNMLEALMMANAFLPSASPRPLMDSMVISALMA